MITQVAKTAHAVHLAYCKTMGLETQPVWEELTEEHKDTIISSVKQILDGDIKTVEESHDNFVKFKKSSGWVYGKEYSRKLKTSPRICEFVEMGMNDTVKEVLFFECVKSFVGGCLHSLVVDEPHYIECEWDMGFSSSYPSKQKSQESVDNADWEEIPFIKEMVSILDEISLKLIDFQKPIVMQPIWKTEGKSPRLTENCLDVFVWSDLGFMQLFLDAGRGKKELTKINRQVRTIVWLFKMLFEFSKNGQFDHHRIIDELSYNTKNDKAFAVSGMVTHPYMSSKNLTKPRITKKELKNIILGGGQHLLSPERRFDAIIYNSPELF